MQKITLKKHIKGFRFLLVLLLAMIVLFSNFISIGIAAEVVLAWDANDEADLDGYTLYRSTDSSGPPYDLIDDIYLDELADPDNPEVTVTQLEDGEKYYFVLTAFDKANNESNISDEICAKVEGTSIVDCASSSSLVSDSKIGGGGSSGGG
jgi:hypothetical protein